MDAATFRSAEGAAEFCVVFRLRAGREQPATGIWFADGGVAGADAGASTSRGIARGGNLRAFWRGVSDSIRFSRHGRRRQSLVASASVEGVYPRKIWADVYAG